MLDLDALLDAGIPERYLDEITKWAEAEVDEAQAQAVVDTALRICVWLTTGKNCRLNLVGLLFAIGRQDLMGYQSLDDAAQGEDVSHTQVANLRERAKNTLRTPR